MLAAPLRPINERLDSSAAQMFDSAQKQNSMSSSHSWLDLDDVRQASRVGVFTGVMAFWAVVFVPIYYAMGSFSCALVLLSGAGIAFGNLIALRRRVSAAICGNILCCGAFYVYTAMAIFCGGRWAPTAIWYVSMPVLSMVVCGMGWTYFWTAASLLAIGAFTALDYAGVEIPTALSVSELEFLHTLGLVALVLCFHALAYVMTRFERHSRETLRAANRWLQQESSLDPLTRIANRRCFDEAFEREWRKHCREQLPLTVALIDLDFFKEFNDLHGHLAGDQVLRMIAGAIQAGVRRCDDVVARYGGEEFVVILPQTDERLAPVIVERMRREVQSLNIRHPHSLVHNRVTISIGIATAIPSKDQAHFDLLRRADEALYRAKAEGRDRVIHATDADRLEQSPIVVFDGLPGAPLPGCLHD